MLAGVLQFDRQMIWELRRRVQKSLYAFSIERQNQMTEPFFKAIIIAAATVFMALFVYWCIPPMIENPNLIGAFAAGFVNPYASGYAADTLACWAILPAWIAHLRRGQRVCATAGFSCCLA